MKNKTSIWFLSLLFQVFAVSAYADSTSQLNLLKDVLVEKDAETLTFRLEFKKPLKKNPQPVFYKKSVQLDFPDAFIIPAKRAVATQDSMISQVFVVQHDPETLRVRFVIGDEKRVVKNNFHLERKGNGLVIRIDKHPKDVLDKFIANVKQAKASDGKPKQSAAPAVSKPLPKPVVPVPAEEEDSPADKVEPAAKSDETKADILREPVSAVPAIVEKNVFETKAAVPVKAVIEPEKAPDFLKYKEPVATEPPSLLASGWKMLYTLALVLALMFFIFYVFKKVVLKNSVLGGNDRLVKVLSTGYLGPKKTIALVDVAGEVLVLGISDGNIALLTQIHDEEQIEKIKGGNTARKARTRMEEGPRPIAERPAPTIKNDNPFSKYIKQFSSDVESVRISSAASVAELIRKNREKIKAAS